MEEHSVKQTHITIYQTEIIHFM